MCDRFLPRAAGLRGVIPLLGLVAVSLLSLPSLAASPIFHPLLAAHEMTVLLELDGMVYGGLDGGGLVVRPAGHPDQGEIWYAGFGLSGNEITDLAWTGRYLWVASTDGGLTRIGDPGGDADFRQYTSNLGSLEVTAVAGTVIGGSERVFYGMADGGIGQIVDGLSGNIYTAEQDGLVDNDINALVFFRDELFIATPEGVSHFADNLFTTVNEGLPAGEVFDLVVTGEDDLLAGTSDGVYRWLPGQEAWEQLGTLGIRATDLAAGPAGIYALRAGAGSALRRWDDPSWRAVTSPEPICTALASGDDLWLGGRKVLPEMSGGNGFAYLAHEETAGGFTVFTLSSSLVRNAEGVAFDAQGGAWVGSYPADAVSGLQGQTWTGIYALAQDNDYDHGLFNYGSNILAMAGDLQGRIWISQYTTGLIRHDPETDKDTYFKPADSGMSGAYILDMIVHPDGPLIMTHDLVWQEEAYHYPEKVDVLLDTDHGEVPGNWLTLPVDTGGITSTNRIWSAVVERPDVIWFAAEDYGLLRWDINGDAAGPDDPLTWADFSDDRWDGPLTTFFGSNNLPTKVKGLALAPDGSIWAGGNGLVRFSYDAVSRLATVLETYGEKTSNFIPGLVSAGVSDVVVDGNGDVWAASTAGLNRIRTRGGQTTVDAWIDLGNYLANPNYGLLYSTGVIAPLPGTTYRDLAVSPDGRRILLSSDRGAVMVDVGSVGAGAEANLADVYCYPNPLLPGRGEGTLKLDGLPADATDIEAEVYNLSGEIVFRRTSVQAGVGFWDGRNRFGNEVASGMYLVRVSWSGQSVAIPLSVVR